MIVGQRRRGVKGYSVPAGGEILWNGIASAVPVDWEIVTYAYDCFVIGVTAGEASDVPAGSNEHFHANPAATSETPDHDHEITTGVGGATGGAIDHLSTANDKSSSPGHGHPGGSGSASSGGKHAHIVETTKVKAVYPPYVRLYWIRATKATAFPIGGIMLFDDLIANAPGGFYLCNGQEKNSLTTPDLRENFIYGAAKDADVNAKGGSLTHAHENQVIGAAGVHGHSLSGSVGTAATTKNASTYGGVALSGEHGHGLTGNSDQDPNHQHVFGDTEEASSLPLYLMLYFIMRTV